MGDKFSITNVLSAILICAHVIYTVYLHIYQFLTSVKNTIKKYYLGIKQYDLEDLIKDVKKLNKVPQHVSVILGPEEPSYQDLAKIAIWCVASGIPFLSFYDHNGVLKKNENQLYDAVNSISSFHYEKDSKKINGYKNGLAERIKIRVFSLEDGRQRLVELTRQFVKNGVRSSDIDVEFVDRKLRDMFGPMPDPDLALYCGNTCSTYGFLPWQIRVTEFVSIKSHHKISIETFFNSLKFYGTCEQRFGK